MNTICNTVETLQTLHNNVIKGFTSVRGKETFKVGLCDSNDSMIIVTPMIKVMNFLLLMSQDNSKSLLTIVY